MTAAVLCTQTQVHEHKGKWDAYAPVTVIGKCGGRRGRFLMLIPLWSLGHMYGVEKKIRVSKTVQAKYLIFVLSIATVSQPEWDRPTGTVLSIVCHFQQT